MLPVKCKMGMAVSLVLSVIAFGGGLRTHGTAVAQPGQAEPGDEQPPDKDRGQSKTDKEKVQSTWRMICAQIKGRQLSAEEIVNHTLVMRDDQ